VLVCSDKYKDSITAEEVNSTITGVIRQRYGDHVTTSSLILSDGGDGFLKSLTAPLSLEIMTATVKGVAMVFVISDTVTQSGWACLSCTRMSVEMQ
jgi:glycerate kinase